MPRLLAAGIETVALRIFTCLQPCITLDRSVPRLNMINRQLTLG